MKFTTFSQFFRKRRRSAGWTAITPHYRGVYLCAMDYLDGRPVVELCVFRDEAEMTVAALDGLRKEHHLNGVRITTLLAPGEYQILLVDAPNVPMNEIKTAIRWKIKDALHYHIDDATVDVLQIPNSRMGGDRPQALYAIAASNDVIRKRIALFEKAHLGLEVIDIPEMAQRNIAALYEQEGGSLALLTFDDAGGLITFTCDGELYLARRLEITDGQLRDADESVRRQYLDRIELEVQRSLDYFDRQHHHIPVNRVIVSEPEGSGLLEAMEGNMGVPVEPLDLAQVMDIAAVPELADYEFQRRALLPLGAALRQEGRAL